MKSSKESKGPTFSAAKLYGLIGLGLTLLVMSLVSLMSDTLFILMKYHTRIAVGTNVYNILRKENPGAYLYVYIFNITNAEAFLSGKDYKLKVEEVGPFTYQEFRTNEQFELDEDEGVMRYFPSVTTKFIPHLSIGDPRSFNVTVPNVAMLAMSSMLSSQLFFVKAAFNLLTARLRSEPIINMSVESYLWGYDEPLITLGNTVLPGWITFKTMGLMDRLYDKSMIPRLEVIITDKDKFKVKKMNGDEGLRIWGYDNPKKRSRCNSFEDTYEAYAYSPGITKDDKIRIYRSIFCRILELEYVGTISTDVTPEAFVYELNNQTYSTSSDTECLCGEINSCIDGISDMSPCLYGLGIGLSNAHFLHGDPKIYERIDGINPNVEKHGSRFVVDPRLGAVLDTSIAVQVSVMVKNVDFIPKEKAFSNMVVPLGIFKAQQAELPEDTKSQIRSFYVFYAYLIHGIEAIIFIIAMIILAYAARQVYWHWLRTSKILLNKVNNYNAQIPLMDKKHLAIVKNGNVICQDS